MHRSCLYRAVAWIASLVCLAATAVGCTSERRPDLTPVAGSVTLDGKPLPGAKLTFYLSDAPVPGYSASQGTTDEAGKYQLVSRGIPGAVPGPFKVIISRIVNTSGATVNAEAGMDLQQLAMQGLAKECLPDRYSDFEKTELSATVEKGKTEYDFDLKSP